MRRNAAERGATRRNLALACSWVSWSARCASLNPRAAPKTGKGHCPFGGRYAVISSGISQIKVTFGPSPHKLHWDPAITNHRPSCNHPLTILQPTADHQCNGHRKVVERTLKEHPWTQPSQVTFGPSHQSPTMPHCFCYMQPRTKPPHIVKSKEALWKAV